MLGSNPCVITAGRISPCILGETHITAAPLGQHSHLWQFEIQTSAELAIDDDDGGGGGDDGDNDDDDDDEDDEVEEKEELEMVISLLFFRF